MEYNLKKPFIVEQSYSLNWSWRFIANQLFNILSEYYNFYSIAENNVLPERLAIRSHRYSKHVEVNGYFLQNISLCRKISDYKKIEKTVIRMGGNKSICGKEAIMNRIDYIKIANAVIATNRFLFGFCKQLNWNTIMIPNGLDLDYWSYEEPYTDDFVVGFCGNISNDFYRDYKGYDYVLQATKKAGVRLKTALFGNKQIPHEKMRDDFFHKITVLIHPTKGEGCSNTIMEALACGVPVLTTKSAGFHAEYLTDFENVIFIERDTNDIYEKLVYLKKHPKVLLKLSIEGRIFAECFHNIKEISKEYKRVFDKLVNKD